MTRQKATASVDDETAQGKQIVQLARLALAGRGQDIELYLRRLARNYRERDPDLASALVDMLRRGPRPDAPLRERGVTTGTPVDLDSRSPLVRQEWPVDVPVEPVFDKPIRDMLNQLVDEQRMRDRLLRAGLNPARTVLFTGPPGVGKTLAARWIARELEVPFLVLDLSTVMSSFLGKTGSNLRRVLDYAKQAPCVLLLDELDAIAKRRDDQVEVGELKRLVTVLLQEIDDWPATSLLVAATNHSELLDPAVWRRFEVAGEFPLPNPALLRQSISGLLADDPVNDNLVRLLAEVFSGSSFSDTEREINTARRFSVIKEVSLTEALTDLIVSRTADLDFEKRKSIAVDLVSRKVLSQRKASEVLRISRDVIRGSSKALAGKSELMDVV